MRPEYQLLFASTRQDFQESHRQAVFELCHRHSLDWGLVFAVARDHGVAPLLYLNLAPLTEQLPLPPDLLVELQKYCAQVTILKEQRARQLAVALARLKALGIEVMLVKGVALDLLVYRQPWYTFSQDMDIVLKRRREQFTAAELTALGHQLYIPSLEYDFYAHHDLDINGTLPVDFAGLWQRAQAVQYRGEPAYLMPPEDLLIATCVNSCRKRFFRLKSLCDIAETVRAYPQLSWREVVGRAREYDCSAIVYAALLVTERTLGCGLPREVLKELGVGQMRRMLIEGLVGLLLQGPGLASYPFTGVKVFGREVNLAALLPYITYRGYQVWHKLGEVRRAG